MHPVLQVCQLGELRHLELFGVVDFIWVLLKRGEQSLGRDLTVVGDPDYLGFEEVFFLSIEGWVGHDLSVEVSGEDVLDEPAGPEVVGGYYGQLVPLLAYYTLKGQYLKCGSPSKNCSWLLPGISQCLPKLPAE